MNVLCAFANPDADALLRVDAEQRVIDLSRRLSRLRDRMNVVFLQAATIHDLRRALLETRYQVVHVGSHGSRHGLSLESEASEPVPVSSAALAALFHEVVDRQAAGGSPLECVVLNLCNSLALGEQIACSLPYTVAMAGPISDKAAIEFARGFYDALFAAFSIPRAFKEGRLTVALTDAATGFDSRLLTRPVALREEIEFAAPELGTMPTNPSRLRVVIDSVQQGVQHEIRCPSTVSVRWLARQAQRRLGLNEFADVGLSDQLPIKWVLVDVAGEDAWLALSRPEQLRAYAVVRTAKGIRQAFDDDTRLHEVEMYDGIVLHLYPTEEQLPASGSGSSGSDLDFGRKGRGRRSRWNMPAEWEPPED